MVLYNALPKKEYERIFMCKTAKDIWQSLLITHQGNSQVKDNKIDLLVQQYEQFTILEEESIDSGFARFNTIITSLKALDEGFSSKNYVRKFLRALHPKWRAKVTTIEESKDLSSLALDELIGNLKVHEVVMEKDSEIYRGKKERVKSIALKAKKESSDDETSTSGSDDEEYAMAVRNFKKFFRRKGKFVRQPREEKKSFRQRDEKKGKSDRKCFRCGDPNHLIGDCPKPPRNKDQKAFIGGSWSDSKNDAEDKTNDETCLMAQSSNEVTLNSSYYSDNASSLDKDSIQLEYDNLCEISLKIINKNKALKTKRDLLEKEILELKEKIKKLKKSKEIDITCIGFDSSKASTSGTKPINFVGSSAEIASDGSTIKAHGSTIHGSVDQSSGEKAAEHLKQRNMKKYDSDIQYAVSIKEDTAFLCLHFVEDHEGTRSNTPYPENSIRRIQDIEGEYSGRYQTWSLLQEIPNTPYPTSPDTAYRLDPEQEFQSSRKHFKTLSLDESRLPDFDLFSDQEEYSKEEVTETMAETMEQYMRKTRVDYGSGVARPKIEDKDNFELKGQFLKELHTNTFSGSDHEDANEHIKKVLEIMDLFNIPNITIDQVMLRALPMSLTGATSRWLRNKPSSSITTWEDLKTKFLSKYCPPARTSKKMEEINNFKQEPDENLYQAWKRFKELLMKCHQHYLQKCKRILPIYRIHWTEPYTDVRDKPTTIPFPSRLNGYYYEEKKGSYGPQFLEAYSKASHINNSIPRKEKHPGSELVHTKLTVELADRTVKYPKGIAENVLVGIGKFVFPVDFIILDMPEDIKVPLILERPFLSTARAKIDVFKRKITLRVGEEKMIFKSVKPASSIIKRVYMLGLRERMELDLEARLMGENLVLNRSLDPFFGDYLELNNLNVPLELRRDQVDDLMPTIEEGEVVEEFRAKNDARMVNKVFGYPSNCDHDKKIHIDCAYNLKFSCMIDFAVLEDMDAYRDEGMGDVIFDEQKLELKQDGSIE
ncbi:zf-CCHC domain-containing protein [Tanacetum coccineum]